MNSETSNHDFLEPPQQDGEIGRLGPYRVLGRLGTGGMGEVFRAQDSRLKRTVALKLMKKKLAATPASRNRFIEEARSMAAVHHDNVATIFEVGVQDGVPFMAMELLQGQSLAAAMKERGTFDWQDVLRVAKEVSLGLAAAHRCGLVHRDIKPANIWLEEPSGRAKILDFGLAIAGNSFDPFAAKGTVVGSPGYLAPEQARNDPLDDRTDLYSLGVVLYVMCTGKLPLSTGTLSGQLIAIICHPPHPLERRRSDLPRPLCDLVHRLLYKEARDRPPSAEQLASLVDRVAARCAAEAEQSLKIVTDSPKPGTVTPKKATTTDPESSQGGEPRHWPMVVASLACVLGIGFAAWWVLNRKSVANTPAVVAPRQEKPVTPRVTASSLQPLGLTAVADGTRKTVRGQAARYRLQLTNAASNQAVDPRSVNSKARVVAQLVTLLKQPGNASVQRPTFPKKILVSQLPRPGETKNFEIQFLTNNLLPETYRVEIQLQAPDGTVVATIDDRLVIEENLQESDLLGFEILRTHQGDGADTYVRKNADDDFGGKPVLQGLRDNKSRGEHIYLRLDLSRLPQPRVEIDRVLLLLTVRAGGHVGRSEVAVYGIDSDLPSDWVETGEKHFAWATSPCRAGIGSQKYLGQFSFNNAKDHLKDAQDQVRFFGAELDEFLRRCKSDQVTLALIPRTTGNRPIRFHSKEGNPDFAPGLAVRLNESVPSPSPNRDSEFSRR